jgi:hypothetical protein
LTQPELKLTGVYRVRPTKELFENAMESKYGGIELLEKQRVVAEKAVKDELSSIVLIDIVINNPDKSFSMMEFRQPELDQAVYDEAYLSSDGKSIISRKKQPSGNTKRAAFFLHYFDISKPLLTSFGSVVIQKIDEMPKYLEVIMPYRPVD